MAGALSMEHAPGKKKVVNFVKSKHRHVLFRKDHTDQALPLSYSKLQR